MQSHPVDLALPAVPVPGPRRVADRAHVHVVPVCIAGGLAYGRRRQRNLGRQLQIVELVSPPGYAAVRNVFQVVVDAT